MNKCFKKNKMVGFTLVELLAVIVILAIILVIAVPRVMSVIEDSKKATLESTAKMIASAAEKAKVQNTVLGKTDAITCESVAKINDLDYEDCDIAFDDNTAKVTIVGKGKFEGLNVCNGTKTSATPTEEECVSFFSQHNWATIVSNVKSGNYPYSVGDTKTIEMDVDGNGEIENYTIRVANITKCSEADVESKTACGFVLEFVDILTTHSMNGNDEATSSNAGGWPASEMRTYVNNDIYNVLPEELRKGIIDTYVVSSYGRDKTTGVIENENAGVLESKLYWSNDKLYLLSTEEVWAQGDIRPTDDSSRGTSRQLDYYATYEGDGYIGVSTTNYGGAKKQYVGSSRWWLRSARGDSSFFLVTADGSWASYYAYRSDGVSPAFRLAN